MERDVGAAMLRMVRGCVVPNVRRRCESVHFLASFVDIDCLAIKNLAV